MLFGASKFVHLRLANGDGVRMARISERDSIRDFACVRSEARWVDVDGLHENLMEDRNGRLIPECVAAPCLRAFGGLAAASVRGSNDW